MPHSIESDFRDLIIAKLVAKSLTPDRQKSAEELYLDLLHYVRRTIKQAKRQVVEARDFIIPPEVSDGYKLFKKKVEDGADLTPHLSTLIDKLKTRDGLLNDWGVHHFHMGLAAKVTQPKFQARTGYVLLAAVKESALYSIGFWDHEFADTEVINRIQANWPSMNNNYVLNGIVGMENANKSAEEIALMRKHGIMTIQHVNGQFMLSPGGGYASSGDNIQDVGYLNNMARALKVLRMEITAVESRLPHTGPYCFRLTDFNNDEFIVEETSSNQVYRFKNGRLAPAPRKP